MRVLITHYAGFDGVSVAQDVESVDDAMNIAMKNYDDTDTYVVINELTEDDKWGRNWVGEMEADGVVRFKRQANDVCHVASHYLSALINGDVSGLEAGDEYLLEQFVGQYHGCRFEVVAEEFGQMDTYFTTCEVCDKYAMCAKVKVFAS
jgi:hypothetical protein